MLLYHIYIFKYVKAGGFKRFYRWNKFPCFSEFHLWPFGQYSGEVLRLCCQQGGVLSAPYLCGGWLSRLGLVALVFARLSARPCSPLLLAFLGTDHINIHFKFLSFLEGTSVGDPDPSDPYVFGPPENLDSFCFVTSFWHFIFEKWCKYTFIKW